MPVAFPVRHPQGKAIIYSLGHGEPLLDARGFFQNGCIEFAPDQRGGLRRAVRELPFAGHWPLPDYISFLFRRLYVVTYFRIDVATKLRNNLSVSLTKPKPSNLDEASQAALRLYVVRKVLREHRGNIQQIAIDLDVTITTVLGVLRGKSKSARIETACRKRAWEILQSEKDNAA